jgi:NADH-quinone oxidoreductase subunit H
MTPKNPVSQAIANLLLGAGLPPVLVSIVLDIIGIVVVSTFLLILVLFLIWLERKVIARMQDRFGPNRAGPVGLLQTLADAIKLMTKEDTTPLGADKIVYNVAPFIILMAALMVWAVIPFTSNVIGTNANIGLFYIIAISSVATISILMAGWGSNNKFALLGAFRTVAQLISYEVPLAVSLIIPILLARSMALNDIVNAQRGVWFILMAPLAALTYMITGVSEVGRTPFDLMEAESELVAGFHVEYSGMKFGLFFVAEFINAFAVSAITATVFLGGWLGPFVDQIPFLGMVYFFIKTFAIYFVFMWLRATLPRIRIDHMLNLNWKLLVPVTLINLMLTAVVDKALQEAMAPSPVNPWLRAGALLATNVVLVLGILAVLRSVANRERRREASSSGGMHLAQVETQVPVVAPRG